MSNAPGRTTRSDATSWRRNENSPVRIRVQPESKGVPQQNSARPAQAPFQGSSKKVNSSGNRATPFRGSSSKNPQQGRCKAQRSPPDSADRPSTRSPQRMCRSWLDWGRCRKGEACRFSHISADPPLLIRPDLGVDQRPFPRSTTMLTEVWTRYARQNLQHGYEMLVANDAYMAGIRLLLLPLLVPAALADVILEFICLIDVKHVEQQIISLVTEVVDSHDVDEGARCVLDLGTTVLNRVVVHKALLLAVEKYWLRHDPILDLLKRLHETHLLNRTHFEQGIETLLLEFETDTVVDNPNVFIRLGECLQLLRESGLLPDMSCVSSVQLSTKHRAQVLQEKQLTGL